MRSRRRAKAEERTHTGAWGRAGRDPALRWGRARAAARRRSGRAGPGVIPSSAAGTLGRNAIV